MTAKYLVLIILASIPLACSKRPGDAADQAPGERRQDSLKRTITRTAVPNDLQQIAYFYRLYNTEFNRSPASLDEFKTYIQRDAGRLAASLEKSEYVVIWKVSDLSSNAMLAYEKEPDAEGKRYVVMGDASITKLDEQHWQMALPGR
jgi:hypothetical protein